MENYDENTCLVDMLNLQLQFQKETLKKRGLLAPSDSNVSSQNKTYEACYHSACMMVELHEFAEQFNLDLQKLQNITDDTIGDVFEETKFELIDSWIFFLNQLLYTNILPTKSLKYYFSEAALNFKLPHLNNDVVEQQIGRIVIADGNLIHKLRFKKWKSYTELNDNVFELVKYVDDTIKAFAEAFIMLGMTANDVWTFFYRKYSENIKRQQVNGIYEK